MIRVKSQSFSVIFGLLKTMCCHHSSS